MRGAFVKRRLLIFVALCIGLTTALPAQANVLEDLFVGALKLFLFVLAQILNLFVYLLILVAQYNGFMNEPIVVNGWTTLRDLSNMFFVLILLIIAIGTIVKWGKINARQHLRQLILVALLINFSRTIVVFFIDISQVVTLTFLAAVGKALQGGFVELMGLHEVINTTGPAGDALVTFFVATVMMLVTTLVVGVITFIFIARIIALWMVIIFAPVAFLASTLPETDEWWRKWWKALGSNVTVAPVLAFMLWLVFSIVATTNEFGTGENGIPAASSAASIGGVSSAIFIKYFIGIGLLIYSIKLAAQMGAAGGAMGQKIGEKGLGYLQAAGKKTASVAGRTAIAPIIGRKGIAGAGGLYGTTMRGMTRLASRTGLETMPLVGTAVTELKRREISRAEKRRKFFQPGAEAASTEALAGRVAPKGLAGRVGRVLKSSGRRTAEYEALAARGIIGEHEIEKQGGAVAAKESRQYFRNFSGMAPKQLQDFDKKNLRDLDLETRQAYMEEMAEKGEVPTNTDLEDPEVKSQFVERVVATRSKEDAEKILNKIPRHLSTGLADGFQMALATINQRLKLKADGGRFETQADLDNAKAKEVEFLRRQLIQRDPKNAEDHARMYWDTEHGTVGQYASEMPEVQTILSSEFGRMTGKSISDLDNDALKKHGHRFNQKQFKNILAGNWSEVRTDQLQSMLDGFAVRIGKEDDPRKKAKLESTLQRLVKNEFVGDDIEAMIENIIEAAPAGEKSKYDEAVSIINKPRDSANKNNSRAAGFPTTPSQSTSSQPTASGGSSSEPGATKTRESAKQPKTQTTKKSPRFVAMPRPSDDELKRMVQENWTREEQGPNVIISQTEGDTIKQWSVAKADWEQARLRYKKS